MGICNGVQKSLEIIGSTPQGHTFLECWQLWPIAGGARNGAAEENWRWDLNPSAAAIWSLFLGPRGFGSAPFCHVDGAGSLNHGLLLLS